MGSTAEEDSPAPEHPRPADPAATGEPAAGPEENLPSRPQPGSATVTSTNRDERLRNRPLWKKILTPITLAVIGVGLFLVAFKVYYSSSPGELPTPAYATLELSSPFSVGTIFYTVKQESPSVAEVSIAVELLGGIRHLPAKATPSAAYLLPPTGITFLNRPKSATYSGQVLHFQLGQGSTYETAFANFFLIAHDFGIATNSVNAEAAIPEIRYYGTGSPTLYAEFDDVPSAGSYDWSASPTVYANGTKAWWSEPVTGGGASGRVAVGINQANQAHNDHKTFFAGALIGLAGGALLSAVQEALHTND